MWGDGIGFGDWLSGVVRRLREVFPEARFGYPALAPGGDIVGRQQDAGVFLDQSAAVARDMDWMGVACNVDGTHPQLDRILEDFGEKPILVTDLDEARVGEEPARRAIRLGAFLRRVAHPAIEAVLIWPTPPVDTRSAELLDWEAVEILAERINA